jgi:hypothetical protein
MQHAHVCLKFMQNQTIPRRISRDIYLLHTCTHTKHLLHTHMYTKHTHLFRWVNDVSESEDQRLAELRNSLDAVYDVLNNKVFNTTAKLFSPRGLPPANLERWSELRKKTDERTKTLLTSLERAREEYDRKVYELTNVVRPLSEEEIASGIERVGATPELRRLRRNITYSVKTFQV